MPRLAWFASASAGRLGTAVVALLFLILVSAVWVETDSYRIAALVLVLWGIAAYVVEDFRPTIGLMGFSCLGWITLIALRYIALYLSGTLNSLGASEGIYLLPAFYMTVGYMMFAYRRVLPRLVVVFMALSLAMTAITVDWLTAFDGEFHPFLYMNNTIHSSVAGGLIILAAVNVAFYAHANIAARKRRWFIEAIAYLTIVIGFIGLYGAKSKGVWVAIAGAFFVQMILSAHLTFRAAAAAKTIVLLVAFAGFVWLFAAGNWSAISPSYDSTESIVLKAVATGHPLTALREAIASGTVPPNTNVRLMLWHNAIEVWSKNVWIGNGIAWRDLYEATTYPDVGFDIVHNGYLEIAMRYGFLGLSFYAVLYFWTLVMARRAVKRGLIATEAYRFHVVSLVFFFATLLTNSNNRLAIGETFMLVAAAFGFYCFYLMQEQDRAA